MFNVYANEIFQSGTGLITLEEFYSMVNRKHNHQVEDQGESGKQEQIAIPQDNRN